MNTKKIKNDEKGITLIALIVTIIVLIILAAVTIYALAGENNILNDAKNAKEVSRRAEAEEIMKLKLANLYAHDYIKPKRTLDLQEIANAFCDDEDIEYVIKKDKETASLEYIDVSDVTSIYTKLKAYPYEFEIDETLKIVATRNTEGETGEEEKTPENPPEEPSKGEIIKVEGYAKDGLILHYDGINNTGRGHDSKAEMWRDLSGNNKDGAIIGSTWEENRIKFDGVEDGVYVGNKLIDLLKNDNTVEFCCKSENLSNSKSLFGNRGGDRPTWQYLWSYAYGGQVSLNSDYYNFSAGRFYGDIMTFTFKMRKKDGVVELYRDGVLKGSIKWQALADLSSDWGEVWIGREWRQGVDQKGFYGFVYAIRVYNRALDDIEIKDNADSDQSRFEFEAK